MPRTQPKDGSSWVQPRTVVSWHSCIIVSFALSSASLSISIISEAKCFFFLLLTLAGSSSLLLTSSICEVLACALVCGRGGGFWGQSWLRCPCFLQVKHLPVRMSSVLSSASTLLAWMWSRVVSIVSELLIPLFFQATFHCSVVWGFFHCFESLGPCPFIPSLAQISKYFCWNFWATQTHSVQFQGSSALLMMAIYSPKVSPLPNLSRMSWFWRCYETTPISFFFYFTLPYSLTHFLSCDRHVIT